MTKGFSYYRIKMAWTQEQEDGSLAKVKTEDLVFASSYTEAEQMAYAISEDQLRSAHGDVVYEIIKTKITTMLYNDDVLKHDPELVGGCVCCCVDPDADVDAGIYAVKTLLITIDERTGKEKRVSETIHTAAKSNADALTRVRKHYGEMDYVVRDVRFDKTQLLLWAPSDFKSVSSNAN